MLALLDAMGRGQISAEPAVVVADRPAAAGLALAEARGVPTAVVDTREVKPRAAHEDRVVERLREHRVDLVCLAGYMRLLTPRMIGAFPDRILNIHPSLLPAFPGLHAHRQALVHGVKLSGCTVHLVDEECDHGPIVAQSSVPVLEHDTVESLSARILVQEHRIYPEAVALYFGRGLHVEGRRVIGGPGC